MMIGTKWLKGKILGCWSLMGRGEISRIMQGELAEFLFCPFQTNLEAAFFPDKLHWFCTPTAFGIWARCLLCPREGRTSTRERKENHSWDIKYPTAFLWEYIKSTVTLLWFFLLKQKLRISGILLIQVFIYKKLNIKHISIDHSKMETI